MTVGLSVLFLYSLNTGFTSLLNFGRRVSTKYYHTMLVSLLSPFAVAITYSKSQHIGEYESNLARKDYLYPLCNALGACADH